jgi:hypothetical protein
MLKRRVFGNGIYVVVVDGKVGKTADCCLGGPGSITGRTYN